MMKNWWKPGTLLVATAFAAVGLLAQSPGVSFSRDVQPILDHECAKCHDAKKHKGRLDLGPEVAYKNLVNVPSAEEKTIPRVTPGDPAGSYLWLKLEHKAAKGSGMPKGLFWSRHLSEKDMGVIKAWIEGGARP
jgi:hypothetical protein